MTRTFDLWTTPQQTLTNAIRFALLTGTLCLGGLSGAAFGQDASATDEDGEAVDLEPVTITGESQPFLVKDASAATLTPVSIDRIPLNISVISRNLLDSRQITELNEAVLLNASVNNANSHSSRSFGFIIRGFAQDASGHVSYLVNGQPTVSPNAPPADVSAIERIEFLKGSSALLYGSSEPGGVINFVYKRPQAEAAYAFNGSIGSFDSYRADFDATGAVTENLNYRFTLGWEDSEGFIDFDYYEKLAPAIQLAWSPTDRTDVYFKAEYISVDANPVSTNVAVDPTTQAIIDTPVERYFGFANDYSDQEQKAIQLEVDHELSDDMTLLVQAGYNDEGLQLGNSGYLGAIGFLLPIPNVGFNPATGDISRGVFDQQREAESYYVGSHLLWSHETEAMTHNFTVGLNYSEAEVFNNGFFDVGGPLFPLPFPLPPGLVASAPPSNVFDPVVVDYPHRTDFDSPDFGNQLWRVTNYGLNVQDIIEFKEIDLTLMLGLRWAKGEYEVLRNFPNNDASDDKFLPRVGALYGLTDTLSVFGSYSESFRPPFSSGVDANGTPLTDPEEGNQYELGLRKSWFNGRLSSSAAIYRLTKENVIVPSAVDPNVSELVGEQRSEGFELDVVGNLAPGWDMFLSYAYTDTEVLNAGSSSQSVGQAFPGVPENKLSLWSTYMFQGGSAEGLGFGYGVDYTDSTTLQGLVGPSTTELPSYTVHNASLFYRTSTDWGPLAMTLGVKNLTDEDYLTQSTFITFINRGEPRRLDFTVNLNF
ncbi:MAG: TonB-dependent receptor [Pseudomonadota bacterium]